MYRLIVVAALVLAPHGASANPHRKPAPINVAGDYDSTYQRVVLRQHGTIIEGEYACCGGGTIDGKITGKVIHYHWAGADGTEGNGVWTVVGRDALRGTWGSEDSEDDGGEWNLDRIVDDVVIAN